jgi:radical SAM protein with 4Fe4S-binding SPASM domain
MTKQIKKPIHKNEFVLQWHITDNCDMNCSHCYIPEKIKRNEIRDNFPFQSAKKIIDEFSELVNRWDIDGRINFSGGNPALHKDLFKFLEYTNSKNLRPGILGNPASVLDESILHELKKNRIYRYQISIDGLKENHEKIRGDGTFDVALESIDKLVSANIPVTIMNTVTTENINDIPELAKLVYDKGAVSFAFARLVPIGEGENLSHLMPTPQRYRKLLADMHEVYMNVGKERGKDFRFPLKDPLWRLFYHEEGLLNSDLISSEYIFGGCGVGISSFCIDVNGDAYSCRRLEIPVGNVFEKSLRELFVNAPIMKEHRNYQSIEGCNECDLISACRGCRAVANAVNGKYTSKDPQCWKSTE